MFGYIKTDTPYCYVKDTVLYRATYCGLCKGLKKSCGIKSRFLLNYDLTFLSVLLHNVTGNDFKIEKRHCMVHPVRRIPVAVPDELTEDIARVCVILAYYKFKDDISDEGKGKIGKRLFNSSYKRAKGRLPEIDKIVESNYKALTEYEKKNTDSVDMVSDPFGNMMREIVAFLVKDKGSAPLSDLAYNLGKWIYLIDAIDDYDKDKKRGGFNIFYNAYKEKDKESLLLNRRGEIDGIFTGLLNTVAENNAGLKYNFNHDLTDNILIRGLKTQTDKITGVKK